MKTYSPLIILALWMTALVISSMILYSCQKPELPPMKGNCSHHQDTTSTSADSTAQN